MYFLPFNTRNNISDGHKCNYRFTEYVSAIEIWYQEQHTDEKKTNRSHGNSNLGTEDPEPPKVGNFCNSLPTITRLPHRNRSTPQIRLCHKAQRFGQERESKLSNVIQTPPLHPRSYPSPLARIQEGKTLILTHHRNQQPSSNLVLRGSLYGYFRSMPTRWARCPRPPQSA